MKKEFIPYEQALALRELGFDEPCLAFYNKENKLTITGISKVRYSPKLRTPTYSQAFRLFRDKYDIYYVIEGSKKFGFQHTIYDEKETYEIKSEKTYNTYEEAKLECLKKLIEIIKDK